ncbi:UDP-N-acetylglucosamine 2-epimerase [Helicobacter equorum]|uniref:UDP-N-acetylglucosamine 2-epimerase n=1 Tax=Helicobacter equorum TaxID=361872 RepID=UPI000CF1C5AF|nr:UDP-N-acetylglucosamine 2-epimerase [Helicobacter equorum]
MIGSESNTKKIVFLTGTRADFSKIKSILNEVERNEKFELFIFVTGMHMSEKFGQTYREIEKNGFKNIYKFINFNRYFDTDSSLSVTIDGFSRFVHEIKPDLIVVHGDRIEPLAAAIVGGLNNILVAHIEGGEISGTIDDSLRHAISKLSHIHFVNDEQAKKRLLQMGESKENIHIIGSPDLEILHKSIGKIQEAKRYYEIEFKEYAIVIFHPVTTEIDTIQIQARHLVKAIKQSAQNFIVIYPNNDLGFDLILKEYEGLQNNKKIKIFPSLRFEYFIALLKHAKFIIGNSSCILKEAVYLNTKGILIGTRQNGRAGIDKVLNIKAESKQILDAINSLQIKCNLNTESQLLDSGILESSKLFIKAILNDKFFNTPKQKIFNDL